MQQASFAGKGDEAGFAVVAPHSACADPPERQGLAENLMHGAVDADAPRRNAAHQLLPACPLPSERIEGEGGGVASQAGYQCIEIIERQHRQDGAEDLLLHQWGVPGGILYQRWRKVMRFTITFAPAADRHPFEQF